MWLGFYLFVPFRRTLTGAWIETSCFSSLVIMSSRTLTGAWIETFPAAPMTE